MVHWKALVESFAVVYVVSSECFCRLHYRLVDFGRMVDSKVPKSTIESTNWSKDTAYDSYHYFRDIVPSTFEGWLTIDKLLF
jgi:hypothetical protein